MKEVKNVPELRFSGFVESWSWVTLRDIVKVIDCKHRTPPYVKSGIPVISPGTIKWGEIDLNSPTKMVTDDEYQLLMNHCDPDVGDFVFSRNQSVGVASILYKKEKFVLGQDTVLIQAQKGNSFFLYFRLQTDQVQNSINRLSGGSTFSRINLTDIRNLKLKITANSNEQTKIANFLTTVEERINLLTQQKEKLEQYKKGVMQKIFSQQLRFKDDDGNAFPDWEEKRLGEMVKIQMGQSPDSKSYNTNRTGLLLIQGNADIEGRISLPRQWTSSPTKICDKGDLLLTVRAPVGAIAKSNHYACIGRGVCSIKSKKSTNIEFIYQLLLWFEPRWIRLEQGSTFTAVSGTDIKNLKLKFPDDVIEQQKIASFLSSIDNKIELVNQQIDQTKTWKKGLLQKMFV